MIRWIVKDLDIGEQTTRDIETFVLFVVVPVFAGGIIIAVSVCILATVFGTLGGCP